MTGSELTAIRKRLKLGPVDMGRAMNVPYTTYRDWQTERRKIPAVAARCAYLLCKIPNKLIVQLIENGKKSKK